MSLGRFWACLPGRPSKGALNGRPSIPLLDFYGRSRSIGALYCSSLWSRSSVSPVLGSEGDFYGKVDGSLPFIVDSFLSEVREDDHQGYPLGLPQRS